MKPHEHAPENIQSVTQIIKQHLTKAPNAIESWAVSEWIFLSETVLALRVHARYLNGIVRITYDKQTSLYNIDFLDNKSALSLLIRLM